MLRWFAETQINEDIQPLPPSWRTWEELAILSFWAMHNVRPGLMALEAHFKISITNWQTGAPQVAVGISIWQAVIAIIVAKVIIALVVVSMAM